MDERQCLPVSAPTAEGPAPGAWLMRCHPEQWEVAASPIDEHRSISTWVVERNPRTAVMAPGQRVLLWAPSGTSDASPCIWGLGWVTGRPHDDVPADLEPEEISSWLDQLEDVSPSLVQNVVDIDVPALAAPIGDAELAAAGCCDVTSLVAGADAEPQWISAEQVTLLQPLLPLWPDFAPAEEALVTVGPRSAGTGDRGQHRIVQAAAVAAVRRQYEDLGWQVDDVSARRLAWDLVCARDQDVRRVRVKGLTGDDGGIVVSAVEMDAARWIEDWTLAVV